MLIFQIKLLQLDTFYIHQKIDKLSSKLINKYNKKLLGDYPNLRVNFSSDYEKSIFSNERI